MPALRSIFIRTAKMLFICAFAWMLCTGFHPYFVSTTEINCNTNSNSIEITCRMFTDNLEDALEKNFKKQIDIVHPADKKEVETMLNTYINKHLEISINGKKQSMTIIGYEHQEDAIWTYLETKKCEKPKTVDVNNDLLYDMLPKQLNMVHVMLNGKERQSSKVTNPDTKMTFKF